MSEFSTPHVVGIIGDPVAHSWSPAWHNALYQRLQWPWVYLPIRVRPAQLARIPLVMRQCDIEGLNVTAPHKVAIVPYLDRLDRDAACAGAVNCIRRTRQALWGHNTDIAGFRAALRDTWQLSLRALHVVLLGTGGAARACAVAALRDRCAQLTIVGRSAARSNALVRHLRRHFPQRTIMAAPLTATGLRAALRAVDSPALMVQATSASARVAALVQRALAAGEIPALQYYCDCSYGPAAVRPRLPRGVRYQDGTAMLYAQAIESVVLWTGQRPPPHATKTSYTTPSRVQKHHK